jgi:SPP1 family predicted phage head-tail adaptor
MNDIITLVSDSGRREVFAELRSISQTEHYQAAAVDYHPEYKFVIADYLDYQAETLVEYEGNLYRVVRTFRAGQELEIVVERASAEEVELYGQDRKA